MTTSDMNKRDGVFSSKSYAYHSKTKHTIQSLYSSGHRLDWATQPNPFRTYHGAENISLPTDFQVVSLSLSDLIRRMLELQNGIRTGSVSSEHSSAKDLNASVAVGLQPISDLFFYSLAISAWKQIKGTSESWALRVNPSSGNLHPTEAHILFDQWDGIESGVYHYQVKLHALERRATGNFIKPLWAVLGRESDTPPQAIICLTSIFWREAWKYRERAFRYCQLDLGHASAALCLSAALLGWETEVITQFVDKEVKEMLGLTFDEEPMVFIPFYAPPVGASGLEVTAAPLSTFVGEPNQLSSTQISYDVIGSVFSAGCLLSSDKFSTAVSSSLRSVLQNDEAGERLNLSEKAIASKTDASAQEIIRTRRSAVEMDPKFRTSLARLSRIIIDSTRGYRSTFSSTLDFKPSDQNLSHLIDILMYVHKIDGIAPGVYHFDRNSFDLTCLNESNCRNFAKYASCMQDIACDGVFAVSLVADMQAAYQLYGERFYRYVHQEAGFIGHMFYLTAKSMDIDATGIGCFLDDEINRSLPEGMEVVYNFTFGRALHDDRLTELPAYKFLAQ